MSKHVPNAKRGHALPLHRKISRVIHSLAKSSMAVSPSDPEEVTSLTLEVSEEAVTQFIQAWRERTLYVPSELVVDPAWGMLLELFHAEIQGRRVSVMRLCKVSGVSSGTAVRWLKALENRELVVRRAHAENPDSESVELSRRGSSALRRYFHEVVRSSSSFPDQG